MTAIGKLLVLSCFVAALGMLTWATSLYAERPGWYAETADEDVEKGNKPVNFKQMKTEMESLARSAAVASEAWGVHMKTLEEREKLRADRKAAYAERIQWAHKGNPKDLIDKANPKSGKGFYEPVVDPATKLYDMSKDAAGLPKGKAIKGTDDTYLTGVDGLLNSISTDTEKINELNKQILDSRKKFDDTTVQVQATEERAIKMGIIRDSVQSELFFLQTFEVNVNETRATVIRRELQLRNRLKGLGVYDP